MNTQTETHCNGCFQVRELGVSGYCSPCVELQKASGEAACHQCGDMWAKSALREGYCPDCAEDAIDFGGDQELEAILREVLSANGDTDVLEELQEKVSGVVTFADAGVMTRDRGVVLSMRDGSQYQITIIKSR